MLKRSIAAAVLLLGLPCAALADSPAQYCTSTGGAVQTRIPT